MIGYYRLYMPVSAILQSAENQYNQGDVKMNEKKSTKGKIVLRVLLCLLLLLVCFTAVVFTVNKVKLSQEHQMFEEAGYYNPVSVGDYSLNVYRSCNKDGKHRIVALAGGGVSNFGLHLTPITDQLSDDNEIIVLDRAGYGLSDDTKTTQTVEQIVSDYRTALKNAGVEAPYILLPHSIGGAYATYWVSEYPDEIEGIVFLDGTQLGPDAAIEGIPSHSANIRDLILCKLGFYRLASSQFIFPLTGDRTEEEQKLSYALNVRTGVNYAVASETELTNENIKFASDNIKNTEVPKAYICSSWGYTKEEEVIENMKWTNEQRISMGMSEIPVDPSVPPLAVEQAGEMRETVLKPYLEEMGNCELFLVAGDHFIFDQKPDECAGIIKNFLSDLDSQ